MLARELIDRFADAGVRLSAENGRLAFEGPREVLTPERIEELRRHQAELLAALAAPDPVAFEERSAIAEHDGGMLRPDAETPAAPEPGFDDAASPHGDQGGRWATAAEGCGGWRVGCPAGMTSTRSRDAWSMAAWARLRCPRCTGSKVPPRMPTFTASGRSEPCELDFPEPDGIAGLDTDVDQAVGQTGLSHLPP